MPDDATATAATQDAGTDKAGATETTDIVVIGAGFSGMYALHRLSKHYDVIGIETGDGVGGTWYWNRYPGARVDIESMEYSYSFDDALQQEWKWPEMFSAQPDLERYANHVADRFHVRDRIRFGTRVTAMTYDAEARRWHVHTDRGEHIVCRYVVAATGSLTIANFPDWPGRDSFQGELYHTSRWPREGVDVTGKRVGIIGTGSTAIQAAPMLAENAAHLSVFQRTPAFSIPSGNQPMSEEYERDWKSDYAGRRDKQRYSATGSMIKPADRPIADYTPEEQQQVLEEAWRSRSAFQVLVSFKDIMTNPAANEVVSEFVRNKIRQTVKDPETAEKLAPKTYPIGAKRLCIDAGYYEMYNRDNVTLVDVKADPIVAFTPTGLRTAASEHELDMIVVATGFDAMTGAMLAIDVTGRDGVKLAERWRDGPSTHLGLMVAGFPNLFMVHGPQSPSALATMILGGEVQVDWIAQVIDDLERDGLATIEPTPDAEAEWVAEMETVASYSLHKDAESWYTGANIAGKPRNFMVYIGGFDRYNAACRAAIADYSPYERAA